MKMGTKHRKNTINTKGAISFDYAGLIIDHTRTLED